MHPLARFGKPDIPFVRIGFGGWQLANPLWGEVDVEASVRLVRAAIDKGVVVFDTAPGYAAGMSEAVIGRALSEDRDRVVIVSKFGHLPDGSSDWREAAIEPAVRDSLARLQTGYLDALLLHNPARGILAGETGHFAQMKRLKQAGLIRAVGISIDTREELELALDNADVDVVELLFNVFFQAPRDLFARVKERGIFLMTKVPLDSGWLTGKYDETAVFTGIRARWTRADIERRAALMATVKTILGHADTSLDALAFLLSYDAVSCVIPGTKSIRQLNDNLASLHAPMAPATKRALERFYDENLRKYPLPW